MRWLGKLSLALSVVLSLSGVTAAQAADATLDYNSFLNSPGYQVLAAEYAATTNFLSNQAGVRINSVDIATLDGVEQSHVEIDRLSTSVASSVTITSFQGGSPIGQPWGSAFANGYVYVPIFNAMVRPDLKNGTAALARLKATSAPSVRMSSAAAGSEFVPYSPTEIMGGSSIDPLAWLNDNTEGSDLASVVGLTFSDVSSNLDTDNNSLTDYTFTANLPASAQVPARTVAFVVRFNQSHVIESQTITTTSGQITVSATTTLTIVSQITMPSEWIQNAVDWPTLVAMGKRIGAEKALAPKARAITLKATAASKKRTVLPADLLAAAKSLKYAFSAIKNGLKISTKYLGQTGSICVTVIRGKASTGAC